jgi:transcriptional regulator with XRE-family HTH domain
MKKRLGAETHEQVVAARIEVARAEMGLSMSELALELGMPKATYASKVYGVNTSFRIGEVYRVADIYRARTGRRLKAWPWLDESDVRLLDGMLEAMARRP